LLAVQFLRSPGDRALAGDLMEELQQVPVEIPGELRPANRLIRLFAPQRLLPKPLRWPPVAAEPDELSRYFSSRQSLCLQTTPSACCAALPECTAASTRATTSSATAASGARSRVARAITIRPSSEDSTSSPSACARC